MYYINKPVKTGHWSRDLKTGELSFSETVFEILGVNSDIFEVSDENYLQFIHPDDRSFFIEEFEKSKHTHANVEFVHRVVCPDGIVKTVFEQASVILKKNEPIAMIGTISDIGKQKENEETEAVFSNIYPEVLHSIPSGIFIYKYNEPDQLILLYGNPYAKKLTGLDVNNYIGKEFNEIWPNAKMTGITDSYIKVAKTGEGIELEDVLYSDQRVSGAFRIFVFRIAPDKIAVAFQNVTKILKDEDSLRIRIAQLNATLENTSSVAIQWYDENAKVLYWNKTSAHFYGYTAEEAIGKSIKELTLTDEQEQEFIEIIRNIKKSNSPYGPYELKVRRKNGSVGWVWSSVFSIPLDNKTSGFVSMDVEITERKQMESELIKAKELAEESEKKYSSIVNILPDGVVIHCEGKVVFINDAALKITRFSSADELLGKPVINFVHPDYREFAMERIKKSLIEKTNSDFTEEVFIDGKGNSVDVLVAGIPFLYQGKPAMLTVFTDISKLKSTELALIEAKEKAEENERRFRNSLEFSPIPLAVAKINGEILFLNKQFTDTYGYTQDDIVTIDQWYTIAYPDSDYRTTVLKDWREVLDSALKNNTATSVREHKVTCKSGEVKTVEVSMYPEKDLFIGLFQDVTERKKAEQEIKNNHELVSLFIKMSPIYTYIKKVDQLESKVLYASENYIEMIGVTGTEMVGKTMYDLFPYDFAKKISEDDWVVVSEGKILTLEEDLNDKNYITIKFPINQGNRNLLAGYTIDITRIKKTENELKGAKEKAEESDRLKTAFLQNMSHEIRTPMNAIVGFSALLDQPDLTVEKRKNFTKIIHDATNQLLSIITDILSISSIETNQETTNIEKVSINEIILNLLSIFKPQAFNQNISLYSKKELTDKQSVVYTDKTKLTQILTNLITNALKFTHEGFIEFGYNLKGDILEFYVKDSGIGIKENMQGRIFERFLQANENINKKYGGTGLGLAISKAYTELLGGSIRVESELEKGSVFYFTIPYKSVYEYDGIHTDQFNKEPVKTILVAEDEEFNFLFLEELLNSPGTKIIHAKDGIEAIGFCQSNPEIDLVLMDIKMPGMDGHEAAIQIKRMRPDLPVIAQSAYALEHEREKYFGKCFDDYITKPIEADKLRLVVTKYLG
jgi:PAS domain S-box-containing protein